MESLSLQEFVQNERPKALLLDAYGVFWAGGARGPLPGALPAMEWLRKQGIVVGVLSNASWTAERELHKMAPHGFRLGQHVDFYLTSGEVARSWLPRRFAAAGKTCCYWEIGTTHPRLGAPHETLCAEAGWSVASHPEQADLVFSHIPHQLGQDVQEIRFLQPELRAALAHGLPMVCLNPDHFVLDGEGRPAARQGAVAALYEDLGGQVVYLGKPHPEVFQAAIHQMQERGVPPEQIWMIGDTPETDIRGARQMGLRSALVGETGLFLTRGAGQRGAGVLELPATDRPDRLIDAIRL
jgi:HAD superfamily hydrolase (TIGR01459 family)